MHARRRLDGLLLLHVAGKMIVQTPRSSSAIRIARSISAAPAPGPCRLDVLGDVLEQDLEVDLLLVVRAERHALLLADDREDGMMVELRVVEAVQQVDRAGARGRDADADLAGELRVPARHERRHLLVPRLDELRVAFRAVERPEESVDPVARIAVDAVNAPLAQALEDVVGDELSHASLGFALSEVVDAGPERETPGVVGRGRSHKRPRRHRACLAARSPEWA